MSQAARYVREVKQQLKLAGLTYRQVAKSLALSESAVKQMFSSGNLTLSRLEQLCDLLGMEISDLVLAAEASARQLQQLTPEQESELISDARLLLVAYCLVNHWTFDEIISRYRFTEAEGIRYLARLDRMKMIELLPGNRVKPLIASNFKWYKDGPIERYFHQQVQQEFFSGGFDEETCLRLVKNGDISSAARQQILDRMRAIGQLFDDVVASERKVPQSERQGTTMVLAIRNWELEAFKALERESRLGE